MTQHHSVLSLKIDTNGRKIKPICSFIRRQGRITKKQKLALEKYWKKIGIEYKKQLIDLRQLFYHTAPVILEIGFGMGDTLVHMAKQNPEKNFLGIEVYSPGIGSCLSAIHSYKIKNLRIIWHDAIEVLEHMIPDNSIYKVQIFFPDPWHKKKHLKRRIIQKEFAELIIKKLTPEGKIKITTDVKSYAIHILNIMDNAIRCKKIYEDVEYRKDKNIVFHSKFEIRAKKLGHKIWNFTFKKLNK